MWTKFPPSRFLIMVWFGEIEGGLCLSWKKIKAEKLGNKVRQALICRAADHRRGLPAGKKGYCTVQV